MECIVCGEYGPTKAAAFTQVTGMLVAYEEETASGEMCDACAKAVCSRFTWHTVGIGWAGFKAVCTSVFVVPTNLAELHRLRRVPPTPPNPTEADLARSAEWEEAAILHRVAVFWWVAAGLMTILLAVAFAAVMLDGSGGTAANLEIAAVVGLLLGTPVLVFVGLAVARGRAGKRIAAEAEAVHARRVRR